MMREFGGAAHLADLQKKIGGVLEGVAHAAPGSQAKLQPFSEQLAALEQSRQPDAETALNLALISVLRDKLQAQVEQGRVKPAREQVIGPLLDELEKLVGESPDENT